MKEIASLSIVKSNGNLLRLQEEEIRISQDNHVFIKLYYGKKTQKNGLQSQTDVSYQKLTEKVGKRGSDLQATFMTPQY